MVSAEALAALAALEHGARFNLVHTISRELMEGGLAVASFGRLEITELGRTALRRTHARTFIAPAEGVSDLSRSRVIDPMSNPMGTPVPQLTGEQLKGLVELQVDVRVSDVSVWRQRALMAAGVASGKTGEWPRPEWVEEFINALEAEETLPT